MTRKSFYFVIVLVIAVGAISTWEWPRIRDASLLPRCAFYGVSNTYELSPEQTSNAATIAAVAIRRGLPKRATTVALAAALQESKLISLDYGDRDSVGLFQQRPSQGWGPKQSLIDPVYSSNKFYSALVRHPGWQQLTIADAAQAVQHSAQGQNYLSGDGGLTPRMGNSHPNVAPYEAFPHAGRASGADRRHGLPVSQIL